MSRITPLVRPNIAALAPYSTARDEYDGPIGIFLDANESPYDTGFNRYPDPHQKALKQRLSALKGLPADHTRYSSVDINLTCSGANPAKTTCVAAAFSLSRPLVASVR